MCKRVLGVNRYAPCQLRICNDRRRFRQEQGPYKKKKLFYKILVAVRPPVAKVAEAARGVPVHSLCHGGAPTVSTGFLVSLASSTQTATFFSLNSKFSFCDLESDCPLNRP
jgi:hypothetical protein